MIIHRSQYQFFILLNHYQTFISYYVCHTSFSYYYYYYTQHGLSSSVQYGNNQNMLRI